MKFRAPSKTSVFLAVSCLVLMGTAASSAIAMPMGGERFTNGTPLLQHTGVGQHRVYPGSDSADAEKARAGRNAPNLFCDKQEAKCS